MKTQPNTPDEAKRLRMFLKSKKITQQDLADLYGKTQSVINRYLTGEIVIPTGLIKLLYQKYNLNTDWIYNGHKPMVLHEKENRSSLVTDISELKSEIETLKSNLAKMQRDIKMLAAVLGAKRRHNGDTIQE